MANFRDEREKRETREREGAEINCYLARWRAVRCGKGSAISPRLERGAFPYFFSS